MATNYAGLNKHQKEFASLVEESSRSSHPYTVFKDFCELAALSFSNVVDRAQFEVREARYLQIVKGYKADEVARFPRMLACLTLSLEEGMNDCLGQLFMALELGNSRAGQFFTPYPISVLMAKMLCGDAGQLCKEQGSWDAKHSTRKNKFLKPPTVWQQVDGKSRRPPCAMRWAAAA